MTADQLGLAPSGSSLVFYLICVTVTWAAYVRRRDATSLV